MCFFAKMQSPVCLTIAPFTFEVKKPIGIPQDSSAYVDQATVNNYATSYAADLPTGDLDNGEYEETEWIGGDLITSGKLNKIESVIDYLVGESANHITMPQFNAKLATKSGVNHKHDEYISSTDITRIEVVPALPEVEEDGVLYIVKE